VADVGDVHDVMHALNRYFKHFAGHPH
jgi:hypothetical protein